MPPGQGNAVGLQDDGQIRGKTEKVEEEEEEEKEDKVERMMRMRITNSEARERQLWGVGVEWIIQLERGEIHRGMLIPSVLQIRTKIATAEGQDQDFNIEPRGTERATLLPSEKRNYYFRQPPIERNKKRRKKKTE